MDLAIVLRLGAFALERTIGAGFAPVVTSLALIAIVGFGLAGVEITQALLVGTDEPIGLRVILKTISAEGEFAKRLGVAIAVSILIEGGVLEG